MTSCADIGSLLMRFPACENSPNAVNGSIPGRTFPNMRLGFPMLALGFEYPKECVAGGGLSNGFMGIASVPNNPVGIGFSVLVVHNKNS
jgi:hypothetical protein